MNQALFVVLFASEIGTSYFDIAILRGRSPNSKSAWRETPRLGTHTVEEVGAHVPDFGGHEKQEVGKPH